MTSRNIPFPRYRPTIWCINPACHAPIPADALECPECGEPVAKSVRHVPRSSEIDVETLLREGRY
ncbi:hypothetical protein ACFOPQ_01475 [Deinococcus antarcticus]|uniref:Zinc ribbon domain-containing protein n=1 Tax=Deinococcus antarcticus TaxID=1298767 RepID=A0ABV8A2H6_9DEIO